MGVSDSCQKPLTNKHTVRDAVLARAARLSTPARRLLEAVAALPPRAELWLVEEVAGDVVSDLEDCLTSGMLASGPAGVAFRHELARLTVEESLTPDRKLALHREALKALADPPSGEPDLDRPARHAEGAGDAEAVLRFAPAAANRAATVGAHREAAAHYARALPFAHARPPEAHAELLERHSHECYEPGRRGNRRARTRDRAAPRAGRRPPGGHGPVLPVADPMVPRPQGGLRTRRARGRRVARAAARRARARLGLPDNPKLVTMPNHPGDLRRPLVAGILKDAGISRDRFLRLL